MDTAKFTDKEMLELTLQYIFTRGDVNEIASRLLSQFKSYAKVLNASKNELMKIKGIGETVAETKAEDLSAISQRLEIINLQLARRKDMHRKILRGACIALCGAVILIFAALFVWNSPYSSWDYSDPETAVVGVFFHAFEWLFVRLAPVTLAGARVGAILTRRRG